jgi:hypothetical protein
MHPKIICDWISASWYFVATVPMDKVVSGKYWRVRDQEVAIERPDGSRVNAIANIRPLKNKRREVTGAINCFYDLSERKVLEQIAARPAAIGESSHDAILPGSWYCLPKLRNLGADPNMCHGTLK